MMFSTNRILAVLDNNQEKPGCVGIIKYTLHGAGAGFVVSTSGVLLGINYFLENPGPLALKYAIWDKAVLCQTSKELYIQYLNLKPFATPAALERCLSVHEREARERGFIDGFNYSHSSNAVWAYIVPTTVIGAIAGFSYGLYKQFFERANPSQPDQTRNYFSRTNIGASLSSMWQNCRRSSNKSEENFQYDEEAMRTAYVPLGLRQKKTQ